MRVIAANRHFWTLGTDDTRLPPPTKLRSYIEHQAAVLQASGLGGAVPDILAMFEVADAVTVRVDGWTCA